MKHFLSTIFLLIPLSVSADSIPPKYFKLIEKMVNINSGTGNFSGAEKIRSMVRSELLPLGFKETKKIDSKGHQVIAFDRDHTTPKKILLYGHIDTVFSKESPFQKMRIEGDKAYGPGIIDMKGGVVMILHLLGNFKNQPKILDQIRVVICDDEETVSTIGTPFIDDFGKGIPYGLIFEPGMKDGSVVTSHSGVHWIDLQVKGKAAHAGLSHKDGVNACVELSEKIYRISQLTDYSKGLTVSPDVIRGGTKTNIVCDSATAQIDIRFIQNDDLKKTLEKIEETLKDKKVKSHSSGEQVTFEMKTTAHFSSLESRFSDQLFSIAKAVAHENKIELKGIHVGAGTDAGHLAENGMQVLVGVGPYGDGIHTEHEYMSLPSYVERLKMNIKIIEHLMNNHARSN